MTNEERAAATKLAKDIREIKLFDRPTQRENTGGPIVVVLIGSVASVALVLLAIISVLL